MRFLLLGAGGALVLLGLSDLFLTVLNYHGLSFLSSRFQRLWWATVRTTSRVLPSGWRDSLLALAAPLMLVGTVGVWVVLEVAGFALIYLDGIHRGALVLDEGLAPGVLQAFYVSGVTLSTLGYGDVTPASAPYQVVAVVEALIGFGILSLTVSYVLSTFAVVQTLGELAGLVRYHPRDSRDALARVEPHFVDGRAISLASWLQPLHFRLQSYDEGLRRFPIVYYFHARSALRAVPFLFGAIGEVLGALRWGLPEDHHGRREPWIPVLIDQLEEMTDRIDRSLVPGGGIAVPSPLARDAFEDAWRGRLDDRWVAHFRTVSTRMFALGGAGEPDDLDERWRCYREWLGFTASIDTFVHALARDLGYLAREEVRDTVAASRAAGPDTGT